MHGRLPQDAIFVLSAGVDAGDRFSRLIDRDMEEACTLKVREYLASGLPVVSGHRDSGLPADFPFYHQLTR